MKIDPSKLLILAAFGIGAYYLTMRKASAATTGQRSPLMPRYSASPNAYTPAQQNAAGWGEFLGSVGRIFTGMNANTAQQPGYTVGPTVNSRSARDAADANDIFMPGYTTGDSANSRSSRDAYNNDDAVAVNQAGQYIENEGWGEG